LVNFLIWGVCGSELGCLKSKIFGCGVLWNGKQAWSHLSTLKSNCTYFTHHSPVIINCVTYNVVQSMKHYHAPKKYNLLNNFSKQNIVYEKNPYNLCFTRHILPCLTQGINWSDLFSIPCTIWRQNENHCTPQSSVYNFTWLMLPSYALKA
jgi:hypothetical protein